MVSEFGDAEIRERIYQSYRVVYRIEEASRRIVISRFWHAARDKPALLGD
jgi:hypothetical protein